MRPVRVKTFAPTLEASALADNDVFFAATEVTNVFDLPGQALALHSITLSDGDDQNSDVDLYFFDASVTIGTLNAAVSITDADALKCLGSVRLEAATDSDDLINSRLMCKRGIGLTVQASDSSTSLWVAGVIRSGTPDYTATGMQIKLGFLS